MTTGVRAIPNPAMVIVPHVVMIVGARADRHNNGAHNRTADHRSAIGRANNAGRQAEQYDGREEQGVKFHGVDVLLTHFWAVLLKKIFTAD